MIKLRSQIIKCNNKFTNFFIKNCNFIVRYILCIDYIIDTIYHISLFVSFKKKKKKITFDEFLVKKLAINLFFVKLIDFNKLDYHILSYPQLS